MRRTVWVGVALALLAGAQTVTAQGFRFGPHVSWADDFDVGVGATALFSLGTVGGGQNQIMGALAGDWYVDCNDCQYFEVTGGVYYRFTTSSRIRPAVGGGVNFHRFAYDPEVTLPGTDPFYRNSELGVAVLGNLEFPLFGGVNGNANVRATLQGYEQVVLSLGILFGG